MRPPIFWLIIPFQFRKCKSIPHNVSEAEEFNVNYLAGYYADTSDVNDYIYEGNARAIAEEDSTRHLSKIREYAKYGCSNPKAKFEVSEKKIGMFPLYFLAIRDKTNTYVNYAIVNGQTGDVVVDLPVDFKKYILVSLLITIPIFLLIRETYLFYRKDLKTSMDSLKETIKE